MRRVSVVLVGLVALVAAGPAAAQPTPGGLSSEQVEYVDTLPLDGRSNGGRLVGRHFYLTTGKDLRIYDVSSPEEPREVGHLDFDPLEVRYDVTGYQEDPDTNGKVLLRHESNVMDTGLKVIDVRDPTQPTVIGELPDTYEHTISCVLDCTWAYGSGGLIVDLRDPTRPQEAGNWHDAIGGEEATGYAHDVTEVAPGLVLTASNPILLLDARSDPRAPTVLAKTPAPGFVHGVLWPGSASDDFALGGGEEFGPACSDSASASVYTLDTRGWQATRAFRLLQEFHLSEGDPANGRTVSTEWCTHWFDQHPAFRHGGLVAVSWYDQGTRLLKVTADGAIEEVGWFLPWAGSTWSAHWISDRIVYAADHHRGIDILRWTGEIPPPGHADAPPGAQSAAPPGPRPAPRAVSFDDLVRLPSGRRCVTRRSLRIRVRRHRRDPVTALTLRVDGARMARVRGRRLQRPIRLRALPRRRFSLQVEVRTRSGHRTAAQRRYRACGG